MIAFLQCLTKPIDLIYKDWVKSREKDWYRLAHNGQVCKLEKVLNDEFDKEKRRIYIDDGDSFAQEYIFTQDESEKVFLGDTLFVYSDEEYENTGVDFVVYVPAELVGKINHHKLNYLIKYYKLAGKRYRIETI
ncbi:hypothetical protein ACUXZJ_07105 [Flavobacterium sp. TN-1]